jgi:isochorismate pyruvate lyase
MGLIFMKKCNSIEEVRSNIDKIDSEIVRLITERGFYVNQAAKFKKTTDDVKAPQRVEQVISKVRILAEENNGDPEVIEAIYRKMISCFIEAELRQHAAITKE